MSIHRGGLVTNTTPDGMRRSPRVDLKPDPRISTLRPGWLADDHGWRDQLQALDLTDVRWVEHQWDLAGGDEAHVDTSWISMESIGGSPWPLVIVGVFMFILAAVTVIAAVG